jgi:hypothetical protein
VDCVGPVLKLMCRRPSIRSVEFRCAGAAAVGIGRSTPGDGGLYQLWDLQLCRANRCHGWS